MDRKRICGKLRGCIIKYISPKTFASGVDFLGWIHFPNHRVLRTTTKNRMLRNLKEEKSDARVQSYRGFLSHGNGHKLSTVYLD